MEIICLVQLSQNILCSVCLSNFNFCMGRIVASWECFGFCYVIWSSRRSVIGHLCKVTWRNQWMESSENYIDKFKDEATFGFYG